MTRPKQYKKNPLCRKGHDKRVTGELAKGRCKVCSDEANARRPKEVLTPEQKAARKIYLREWRAANPEKNRAYDIKYYWENPEAKREKSRNYRLLHINDPKPVLTEEKKAYLREYRKRYREENREKEIAYRASRKHIQDAYNREYYKQYSEDIIAASCLYYWEHREEIAQKQRERFLKNPELFRARSKVASHNRRAAIGKLSVEAFIDVWNMGDGICAYCFKEVSLEPDDDNHWRLEHCTPISRGGTHFLDNLVVACQLCNNRKYIDTVLEHCLTWKRPCGRYDFFVEENLCEEDREKLKKLHAKYR
jgi:hypothetical protein